MEQPLPEDGTMLLRQNSRHLQRGTRNGTEKKKGPSLVVRSISTHGAKMRTQHNTKTVVVSSATRKNLLKFQSNRPLKGLRHRKEHHQPTQEPSQASRAHLTGNKTIKDGVIAVQIRILGMASVRKAV